MTELEKYTGIYNSPDEYPSYGHGNHGSEALGFIQKRAFSALVDVGCGHNGFVKSLIRARPDVRAVGVDFACPSADIIAAAGKLPFKDGEFDIVTAFDVLEHLVPDEIQSVFREFSRISRSFHFSICYRPSIFLWRGENLHPTVRAEAWWIEQLQIAGAVNVVKTGAYLSGEWRQVTPTRKLTIGMLTYDDFDGVYFTLQSLRLHHPEVMGEVEFLILDNNPAGKHGEAVKGFTEGWIKDCPVRYIPMPDTKGTAQRTRIFEQARTPYVLCLDCHVLLAPGSLRRLIDFMDSGADAGNLLQGPMLYDNLTVGATHMEPVWRDGMWGTWAIDQRGIDPLAEPFEIPAMGMGLFACRKDAWLGFNERFRGFGGEECYIHEKFRQAGKRTECLPFLRWLHRFQRPAGVPYPNKWGDRVINYLLGHAELGLDPAPVLEHFRTILSEADMGKAVEEFGRVRYI